MFVIVKNYTYMEKINGLVASLVHVNWVKEALSPIITHVSFDLTLRQTGTEKHCLYLIACQFSTVVQIICISYEF